MMTDRPCDTGVPPVATPPGSLISALHLGQHVRAMSGWEGYVCELSDVEACGQGRLVTCAPITLPAPPWGGHPWRPITVTEAELQPTGQPDRGERLTLEALALQKKGYSHGAVARLLDITVAEARRRVS